jgi:hypothetical protein
MNGGRTAILHESLRTGKWTWEDSYWRSLWNEEFDTEKEALLSAKGRGYVFASTPGTPFAMSIDRLLEGLE